MLPLTTRLSSEFGVSNACLLCQAYQAFTPDQRKTLRKHVAELHHAPIETIEHVGGGGVRCSLAEIF